MASAVRQSDEHEYEAEVSSEPGRGDPFHMKVPPHVVGRRAKAGSAWRSTSNHRTHSPCLIPGEHRAVVTGGGSSAQCLLLGWDLSIHIRATGSSWVKISLHLTGGSDGDAHAAAASHLPQRRSSSEQRLKMVWVGFRSSFNQEPCRLSAGTLSCILTFLKSQDNRRFRNGA